MQRRTDETAPESWQTLSEIGLTLAVFAGEFSRFLQNFGNILPGGEATTTKDHGYAGVRVVHPLHQIGQLLILRGQDEIMADAIKIPRKKQGILKKIEGEQTVVLRTGNDSTSA